MHGHTEQRGTPLGVVAVPQEGHPWDGSQPVFAISPDEHYVVSSSMTRLKLWNAQGELLRDLDLPSGGNASTPIFSQDGAQLLLVGGNSSAIYAMPSGQKLRDLEGTEFSQDARFTLRRDAEEIRFADARTGRPYGKIRAHPSGPWPEYLNFSPDGRVVAAGQTTSADADGKMRLWNVRSGRLERVLSDPRGGFGAGNGVIGPVAWSPDGKTLVTGGEDPGWQMPTDDGPNTESKYYHAYALKVWDVKTGRLLRVCPGYGSNTDGVAVDRFVSAHEVLVGNQVVDVRSGRVVHRLDKPGGLSRDGRLQVAYTNYQFGTFELRETWTGKVRARYPGRGVAAFKALAWSADGALLAAAESRGTPVRVFDARTGALKFSLSTHGEAMLTLRWLPSDTLNVNTLQSSWLWDRDGHLKRHWRPPAKHEYNESTGVSPDGALFLAQGNDHENEPRDLLRIWDANGTLVRDIPHFSANVGDYACRLMWLDNIRLAKPTSAAVEVWNLRDGSREAALAIPDNLKHMYPAAVSPDGRWLICTGEELGSGDTLHYQLLLWDLRQHTLHRVYHDAGPGAQWSGDSSKFVTSSGSARRASVFTMDGDSPQATLPVDYNGQNTALAMSPDFKLVATKDGDYTATTSSIWNTKQGKIVLTLHLFMAPHKNERGSIDEDAPAAWLALTPGGFYDGAPNIEQWLRWRRGQVLLPVGALQKERRQSARIRAALKP